MVCHDFTQLVSLCHCIVGAATFVVCATDTSRMIAMTAASSQRMKMLSIDSVLFIALYLLYSCQIKRSVEEVYLTDVVLDTISLIRSITPYCYTCAIHHPIRWQIIYIFCCCICLYSVLIPGTTAQCMVTNISTVRQYSWKCICPACCFPCSTCRLARAAVLRFRRN